MSNIPGFDPVPLHEYDSLLMITKEHFDKYWTRVRPMIDRCIKRAMHGEITVDDVLKMAQEHRAFIFIVKCDKGIQPDIKLVVVVEMSPYPQLQSANILALAGSDLDVFYERFWDKLCGWAYMNGIRAIEGLVAPAMQRVISKYGFKPVYTQMRLDLTEA
jgi:hypothetical protein